MASRENWAREEHQDTVIKFEVTKDWSNAGHGAIGTQLRRDNRLEAKSWDNRK